MAVRALVLRTAGTNCEGETLHALTLAGAKAELLHLRELLREPQRLDAYSMMVIPGGFSYGDDIAAGKILANELKFKLGGAFQKFVSEGKLVIGICNGFQALVKAGFLPGSEPFNSVQEATTLTQTATLIRNSSGRFQCEWIGVRRENSMAKWLERLPKNFQLPIAHGEGRFVTKNSKILKEIEKNRQIVFRYFPKNPNGSLHSIAGICNGSGNVIGLMPHPERFVTHFQHPAWSRISFEKRTAGLLFWQAAVQYAKGLG